MARERFDRLGAPELREEPIVMNFEPEPRRLIDTPVPSKEAPSPDTPFIGEENAQASSLAESESGENSPRPNLGEPDRFDDLGSAMPAHAKPEPEPAPAAPVPDAPTPLQAEEPAPLPEPETAPLDNIEPLEPFEKPAPPLEEPRQMARAEAPLAPPPQPEARTPETPPESEAEQSAEMTPLERVAQTTTSEPGDAPTRGFVGFEAKQSELAPYLKQVRRTVENQWRALLQIRYTGTTATEAILDCAIRPDGTLAYVRIVEPGDSPTYGALCKVAVEKAGPFGPFPFEVPEIYRRKNLEIRWTFSYFQ